MNSNSHSTQPIFQASSIEQWRFLLGLRHFCRLPWPLGHLQDSVHDLPGIIVWPIVPPKCGFQDPVAQVIIIVVPRPAGYRVLKGRLVFDGYLMQEMHVSVSWKDGKGLCRRSSCIEHVQLAPIPSEAIEP